MTGGAGKQHSPKPSRPKRSERFVVAPGRWATHTWSFASTNTAPTLPIIHFFGSSFGHAGSYLKDGIICRVAPAFFGGWADSATAPAVIASTNANARVGLGTRVSTDTSVR